jgi:signal transduction histidine kinase
MIEPIMKKNGDNNLRYQKKLQSLASELLLEEEHHRKHIAAGLHDQVGSLLSVAGMKIAILAQIPTLPADARRGLKEIRELLHQAIQLTRSLTFELSPPRLYTLGLIPALEWLADHTKKLYGIHCSLENRCESAPLSEETQVLLYQIVRELLDNVTRHAEARYARITVDRTDPHLQIVIEDDGVGFNPQDVDRTPENSESYGLFAVRERLNYLDGDLAIDSSRGKGTRITVTAPVFAAGKGSAEL